jgi:hypothetical protein
LYIDANKEPHDPAPNTPFNNIPPQIAHHRALLFTLATPVSFSKEGWEQYWPFIDNVWSLHQRPKFSAITGWARIYGACRLARKVNYPDPPEGSRPRARRDHGMCKAQIRVTVYADGSRHVKRTSEEGHTHDLEFIDGIKRNSGVRSIILDPFFKGWEPGGILAYIRDALAQGAGRTADAGNAGGDGNDAHEGGAKRSLLEQAGGLCINRQEVQNVLNAAQRRAHPGQDPSFVKKQMDKYRKLITCTAKGCNAPPFPDNRALMDHRRRDHGLRTHDHSDKLYGCPEKTCWRRKKSKGFSTLLGLEDHVKKRHPERIGPHGLDLNLAEVSMSQSPEGDEGDPDSDAMEAEIRDGQQEAPLAPFEGYNAAFNISGGQQPRMLLDAHMDPIGHQSQPITPESPAVLDSVTENHEAASIEGRILQSLGRERQANSEEPQTPATLSYMELKQLRLRVARLKRDREKIDQEIAKLDRILERDKAAETTRDGSAG